MKEQTRPRNVLILGGGYAGMIAAARIARGVRRARHAGAAVDVTLLDSKADFVQRIRLHEVLAGRESAVLRAASPSSSATARSPASSERAKPPAARSRAGRAAAWTPKGGRSRPIPPSTTACCSPSSAPPATATSPAW
jgi:2-polyprenyl-6-methoxyphenol hydroxylase-like FAD-dependent oxidoreductase